MINKLNHLAIILDGNKRWSVENNKKIFEGYEAGFDKIFEVAQWCIQSNIKYLTIFTLSSENIKRDNINILLNLIDDKNLNFQKIINNREIKMKFIGNINALKPRIKKLFTNIETKTKNNKKLNVNVAFNYGLQYELFMFISKINSKNISTFKKNILNNSYKKKLLLGSIPDPDLMIRTGGFKRLSNFLQLYISYTEFFFTNTLWPNFSKTEFNKIITYFKKIKRNHGL